MLDAWPVMVVGWPAVAASVICCSVGFILERPRWVLAGAILALPFCLYLAMTPNFAFVAPVAALLYMAAAYALSRKRAWIGGLAMLPFLVMTGAVAVAVLTQ